LKTAKTCHEIKIRIYSVHVQYYYTLFIFLTLRNSLSALFYVIIANVFSDDYLFL